MDEVIREVADTARCHAQAVLRLLVYKTERELGLIPDPPTQTVRTLRRTK